MADAGEKSEDENKAFDELKALIAEANFFENMGESKVEKVVAY